MILAALVLFLIAINLLAILAFRADKRRAARGEWRLSEGYLLLLAFCGGWMGAKIAQQKYRHKTQKEPFRTQLNTVPLLWLRLIALFIATPRIWPIAVAAVREQTPSATARHVETQWRVPSKFFQSAGVRQ